MPVEKKGRLKSLCVGTMTFSAFGAFANEKEQKFSKLPGRGRAVLRRGGAGGRAHSPLPEAAQGKHLAWMAGAAGKRPSKAARWNGPLIEETVPEEPAKGEVSTEAAAVLEESASEPDQGDADTFAYDPASQ
jgi:hypothetical protein